MAIMGGRGAEATVTEIPTARVSEPSSRRGIRAFTRDRSGKTDSVQQGVPGYGPQVVAMQSPSHATIVYRIARGPSPEP